jgi:WD40 repeat protein
MTDRISWMEKRELHNHVNPPVYLPRDTVEIYPQDSKVYCISYSADGNYWFTACQDHSVSFYSTSSPNPADKLFRLQAKFGQWTITDYTLSPSNQFIAYTSLVPYVHLAKISSDGTSLDGDPEEQQVLPLSQLVLFY